MFAIHIADILLPFAIIEFLDVCKILEIINKNCIFLKLLLTFTP